MALPSIKEYNPFVSIPVEITLTTSSDWLDCFSACLKGDIEKVKAFLQKNSTFLEMRNEEGNTLMHAAALGGDLELVKWLHAENPLLLMHPNAQDWTPFHLAIFQNNLQILRPFLEKIKEDFPYFIHGLAELPHPKALALFLENGFDANIEDGLERTPMHFAAQAGIVSNLRCLRQFSAKIDAQDGEGYTPLFLAASKGHHSAIKYLLEHKASLALCLDQAFTHSQNDIVHFFLGTNKRLKKCKDEKREDLENFYTECLIKAVEKQLLEEQVIALKKLSDLYQDKQNYVMSAKCLNGALALVTHLNKPLVEQYFYTCLEKLTTGFLESIGIKRPEDKKKPLIFLREQLRSVRQDCLKAKQTDSILQILSHLAEGFKKILQQLITESISLLGPPPINWACIGIGSLGRGEMFPYDPLEFAILIEKETPEAVSYFRQLMQVVELKVINLGETKFFFIGTTYDSPNPAGFSFDTDGLPLQDFIGTPKELAAKACSEAMMSSSLASNAVSLIMGDAQLIDKFGEQKKKNSEKAARNIIQRHVGKFSAKSPRTFQGFDLDVELYHPFKNILAGLELFYFLKPNSTFEKIEALHKKGVLAEEGASNLKDALNMLFSLRLEVQLFYQENGHLLFSPIHGAAKNPKRFYLSEKTTNSIQMIFEVLLPLQEGARVFLETEKKSALYSRNLKDLSPQAKELALSKTFQIKESATQKSSSLAKREQDLAIETYQQTAPVSTPAKRQPLIENILEFPQELLEHIAFLLSDIKSLSRLSQVNRYFNKIFAAKVAIAQPTVLADNFYKQESWLERLRVEYTEKQPTLSAEDLLSPMRIITQAMSDVVYIYSDFPQTVFNSLKQVVDPMFLSDYKTKVYDELHNLSVTENRPNLGRFAEGLWTLRRIFVWDEAFVKSLYSEGSPKSEDNYRCLRNIVCKHVYTIMGMIAKKVKILHNLNLEKLAALDFDGKSITKIRFAWDSPNGPAHASFSIGDPDPRYHPLKYQLAWLKQEKQGAVSADVLEEIDDIIKCAKANHITSLGAMFFCRDREIEEKSDNEAVDVKAICQSLPRMVEILREASRELLKEYLAIEKDDERYSAAQYFLGQLYSLGIGSEKELNKALHCYQQAAQAAHPLAQYKLSQLSEKREEKMEYLIQAAAKGDPSARWQLAIHYDTSLEDRQAVQLIMKKQSFSTSSLSDAEKQNLKGYLLSFLNIEQDPEIYLEAQKMIVQATQANDAAAFYNLAQMHECGMGVKVDLEAAEAYYLRSAKLGNLYAQFKIAVEANNKKNYKEAAIWFEKAAEQGDAEAQDWMGVLFRKGTGVDKDKQKERYWFQKAALQGHEEAQCHLAFYYVKVNAFNQAREWYIEAALQGNASAITSLGATLEKGEGLLRDYSLAALFYKKSISFGNVSAKMGLAYMLEKGLLGQPDISEAIKYYQSCPENGFACYRMARLHEKGMGVPQDEQLAQTWYKKVFDIAQKDRSDGNQSYRLGLLYQYGNGGVEKNLDLARTCYQHALKADYCYYADEIPQRMQELTQMSGGGPQILSS